MAPRGRFDRVGRFNWLCGLDRFCRTGGPGRLDRLDRLGRLDGLDRISRLDGPG